ncbi:MAG TPA: response regulator transcription factor [Acidobacteriaceae bacterium]|jgi:DNA-binding NarL/FixJ family response regulator
MSESGKVRIGVVAADPLRSLGLQAILQESLGMDSVELGLPEAIADRSLSVLLLDGMAGLDEQIDLVLRVRRQRPELKLIVVGHGDQPEQVQALIGAGAKGYLTDTAGEGELKMALNVVLDGSIWAPRKVLARLIEAAGGVGPDGQPIKSAEKLANLITPREREVLGLLMEGRSNREIAQALSIDEVTVKAHLGRMLRKAGASNRVELTLRALEEQGVPGRRRS